MSDEPSTPEENAVRLYGKPAVLSKWYNRRQRAQEKADGEIPGRSFTGELIYALREWFSEKRDGI